MEKPCNGRKILVTGCSHGCSLMIIIRLSVRILQLKMIFFFLPNRKKVEKCSFSSLFQAGPLHQEETKLACQGEGSALVSA